MTLKKDLIVPIVLVLASVFAANLLSQEDFCFSFHAEITGWNPVLEYDGASWRPSGSQHSFFESACAPAFPLAVAACDLTAPLAASTCDLTLPLAGKLECERSRYALRKLADRADALESFELFDSHRLLARWDGPVAPFSTTELIDSQRGIFRDRSPEDHFELWWTADGFELRRYEDMDKRPRKCTPSPPAVLTETMPLVVYSDNSCLILCSPSQRRLLPLFVVLSHDGTVSTSMFPDEESLASNLTNSVDNVADISR